MGVGFESHPSGSLSRVSSATHSHHEKRPHCQRAHAGKFCHCRNSRISMQSRCSIRCRRQQCRIEHRPHIYGRRAGCPRRRCVHFGKLSRDCRRRGRRRLAHPGSRLMPHSIPAGHSRSRHGSNQRPTAMAMRSAHGTIAIVLSPMIARAGISSSGTRPWAGTCGCSTAPAAPPTCK